MDGITTQASWLRGDGEIASLIRAHDWSATPLGPYERWPQSLRTVVGMVLESPAIASVVCGPERILIHNDAAKILYGAHPSEVLGRPLRESFPDRHMVFSPYYDRVFAGEPVQITDLTLDVGEHPTPLIDAVVTPVRSESGDVAYAYLVGRDVTERKANEARLREGDARFRLMADTLPLIIWITDCEGRAQFLNRQWNLYTGEPERLISAAKVTQLYAHPDDAPATREAFERARREGGNFMVEHRVRSASGEYRWFVARGEPYRDPETGEILRWVGASIDIHEQHQLQNTQQLLIAELLHRTRNLLAIIDSIAKQTQRASGSLNEFCAGFYARLSALSRVQGLLSHGEGHSVAMHELVKSELQAHGASMDDRRVAVRGPWVHLPSKAVQVLILAVHELATNATKYGALSQDDARLMVTWTVTHADGRRLILLSWVEEGVALPDMAPARRGFGRQLIERGVPYDLGAETWWNLTPDGVRCELRIPLEK